VPTLVMLEENNEVKRIGMQPLKQLMFGETKMRIKDIH